MAVLLESGCSNVMEEFPSSILTYFPALLKINFSAAMKYILVLFASCLGVFALSVGDSQQAVKTELGRPVAVKKEGASQIYISRGY